MKGHAVIKTLAQEKYLDAECLLKQGRFDSAYYIAGYCVELLIKARICRILGIEDFFDFDNPSKTKFRNEGNIYKPFKVHDLEQLLVLSGLYIYFNNQLLSDESFKMAWSFISNWTGNARYLAGRNSDDVKDLLTSIKKFELWISNYL